MTEALKPGRYLDRDGDQWEVADNGDLILEPDDLPLVYLALDGMDHGASYAANKYGPFTPGNRDDALRDRVSEALDLDGDEAKLEAIMAIIKEQEA